MSNSLGKRLDERVSSVTDFTARRITRRESLKRLMRGSAVVTAGVVVGNLAWTKPAMASTCDCDPPNGIYCTGCSSYGGCPSHGSPCLEYYPNTNGCWIACTGLGTCGYGYVKCCDCTTPYGYCHCGCQSTCICCNCCSPADVKAEHARLEREAMAAS